MISDIIRSLKEKEARANADNATGIVCARDVNKIEKVG